jgi:hypothetical protein
MRDRDDYPVLSSRLAQLTEGLEGAALRAADDERCLEARALGVTDPRQNGRGILLQIEDGRGALACEPDSRC